MNELDRTLEPLSDAARALLAAERDLGEPPADFGSAVWGRVASTLELPVPAAPGPATPVAPAVASASLASKLAAPLVVAGLAISVGGLGVYFATGPRSTEPPRPSALHPPPAKEAPPVPGEAPPIDRAEPPATTIAPQPAPAPPARPPERPRSLAPGSDQAPPGGPVPLWPSRGGITRVEATTLDAARAALQRGDAEAALTALDDHQRRFADSELAELRIALRIRALLLQRRRAEAARQAAALREAFPRSVYLPEIDRALGAFPLKGQ
ncbi:MAG: hypothetical protein HY901_00610 [Deltaproteobacteria bacterium]|nr:hypothetical protein [Deltaproteobacteria bacterium]